MVTEIKETYKNFESEKHLDVILTLCGNCYNCLFRERVLSHLTPYASNGVNFNEHDTANQLIDLCSSGLCSQRNTIEKRKEIALILIKHRKKYLEEEEKHFGELCGRFDGELADKSFSRVGPYASRIRNLSIEISNKTLEIAQRTFNLDKLAGKVSIWGEKEKKGEADLNSGQ